jgi:hypothetical protein
LKLQLSIIFFSRLSLNFFVFSSLFFWYISFLWKTFNRLFYLLTSFFSAVVLARVTRYESLGLWLV